MQHGLVLHLANGWAVLVTQAMRLHPQTSPKERPMTDTDGIFVTGLRNAHAMEHQALSIMKPQVARIEQYPEVAHRLQLHITETENQIQRLEQLLDGFD